MLIIKSKYNSSILSNSVKQLIGLIIVCLFISNGAFTQAISNVAIISDLEEQKNGFDFTDVNLERTTNYNYITFTVPNRNFYWDNELILPYGSDPDASRIGDISIVQFDDQNKFSKKLIIRCKRELSPFGNIARYNESGILTKEDKLYVYGSMELSDSIMINGITQKRFNGNASFVYRFNENLELEDEYYFSIDSTINNHFAGFEVGENGDYHLAGFFMEYGDNGDGDGEYFLQVSGDSISSTNVELDTTTFFIDNSTYYYVVLDGVTKEITRNIPIQGSGVVAPYMNDVVLDKEDNFFITAEDRGGLSIHGETALIDRNYPLSTVSMSIDKRDSVNFIALYEGLGSQTLFNVILHDDNHIIENGASSFADTLFSNYDYVLQSLPDENFVTRRTKDGAIDWITLLSCENGAGFFGLDIDDNGDIWGGGSAGGEFCLGQLGSLEDLDIRNGILVKIDGEDGSVNDFFKVTINEDDFQYGTPIVNIMTIPGGKLKVICNVGLNNNNQTTDYKLSLGSATIEIPARGELVIFDFIPLVSNTNDSQNVFESSVIYPNPIKQGHSPTIKNLIIGCEIDILNQNGSLINRYTYGSDIPYLNKGIYFLKVKVQNAFSTYKLIIY